MFLQNKFNLIIIIILFFISVATKSSFFLAIACKTSKVVSKFRLITNLILKAQDIDSLENLLQNTTDTIQKMEILEQLSSSSMAKSPEKCKSYAFDLYELAVLNKNQEQQANAFYIIAKSFYFLSEMILPYFF